MILGRFYCFLRGRCGLVSSAAFAVVAGLAMVFFGVSGGDPATPPPFKGALKALEAFTPPRAAPEISFTDRDGKALTLADFKGRVVLLNYWATWCAPCVEEMPALERLHAKLGGDAFTVLAMSVDRQGLPVVEPFLEKLALRGLPIYLDRSGASMRAFGVRGLPTTMIIDRDGREAGRLEGMAEWDSPAAEALLRHYMRPASR